MTDRLTRLSNLVSQVYDQSSAAHRDAGNEKKSAADKQLANAFGEAASKIGAIMKRITRRMELMDKVIQYIEEHGTISYREIELVCGRVGEARIRLFPFGDSVKDETPYAGVIGPEGTWKRARACFDFEEFKEVVEEINGGEANIGS